MSEQKINELVASADEAVHDLAEAMDSTSFADYEEIFNTSTNELKEDEVLDYLEEDEDEDEVVQKPDVTSFVIPKGLKKLERCVDDAESIEHPEALQRYIDKIQRDYKVVLRYPQITNFRAKFARMPNLIEGMRISLMKAERDFKKMEKQKPAVDAGEDALRRLKVAKEKAEEYQKEKERKIKEKKKEEEQVRKRMEKKKPVSASYIPSLRSITPPRTPKSRLSVSPSLRKPCIQCKRNESDWLVLPCMHAIYCNDCAEYSSDEINKLEVCPTCRGDFEDFKRMY